MKKATIDFTGCKHIYEFHQRIQEALDFPEWYGKNWDAFWDLLRSECDADKVIITGEYSLPGEFNKSLRKIHEILEQNKKKRANSDCPFDYEIIS